MLASIQGIHQASCLSRGVLKRGQHDFVFLKAIFPGLFCRHGFLTKYSFVNLYYQNNHIKFVIGNQSIFTHICASLPK
jgi:hypothetical protein